MTLEQLLKHTHDRAAWYWIGMGYWKQHEFESAKVWLEKTMNDTGNEWAGKSAFNLAQLHTMGTTAIKDASIDEAIRLYETILKKNPKSSLSSIHAGLLYCRAKNDLTKGKKLIEDGIKFLIEEDGNDSYLAIDECFKIAEVYEAVRDNAKAIEYFKKAIDRRDPNYPPDNEFVEMAKQAIRELGG